MATGKDIAWTQWAWCGGALIAGLVIGTFVVAPMWDNMKSKKAAKSGETKTSLSTLSKAVKK